MLLAKLHCLTFTAWRVLVELVKQKQLLVAALWRSSMLSTEMSSMLLCMKVLNCVWELLFYIWRALVNGCRDDVTAEPLVSCPSHSFSWRARSFTHRAARKCSSECGTLIFSRTSCEIRNRLLRVMKSNSWNSWLLFCSCLFQRNHPVLPQLAHLQTLNQHCGSINVNDVWWRTLVFLSKRPERESFSLSHSHSHTRFQHW